MKNSDIFHISAQYIDCGYSLEYIIFIISVRKHKLLYSLEPPRRGGSNEYNNLCFRTEIIKIMYTPVNPRFTI